MIREIYGYIVAILVGLWLNNKIDKYNEKIKQPNMIQSCLKGLTYITQYGTLYIILINKFKGVLVNDKRIIEKV